jgi:branched-chain amino acid aminotransferase
MNKITSLKKLPPVKYDLNPPFGTVFAPHVLRMHLNSDEKNDYSAEIAPLAADPFSPATAAFHYGQSIFEGMKAYRLKDGSVGIFRADLHATRFRNSARRMVMADMPEEIFINCLKEYVAFVADNVPSEPGHSLYLRPIMFASEPKLKVGASKTYDFYVLSTIAGSYFSGGLVKSARVLVNREFVRAYPGGLGEIKTAANYAASIWPQRLASQKECDQVLFLDAVHHEYIDEMGGMNFFAIRGQELLTPSLNGSILHGVTRRSIIELAPSLGFKVREMQLSFTELRKQIESGEVTEAFACGTAAVVSPIGELLFQETVASPTESIVLKGKPSSSLQILEKLSNIQRGLEPAPGPWILKCT